MQQPIWFTSQHFIYSAIQDLYNESCDWCRHKMFMRIYMIVNYNELLWQTAKKINLEINTNRDKEVINLMFSIVRTSLHKVKLLESNIQDIFVVCTTYNVYTIYFAYAHMK